jgi:hypothetical protein
MDVSTFELQAKSQNWKKKEKSSVHKQLVDGWKTTEITHYMKTLVGLGANSSPLLPVLLMRSCPDCYERELCQAGLNGSNSKTLVGLGANSSPFVASIADVLLSRLVQMRTMPSLAQLKRFRNSQKSD